MKRRDFLTSCVAASGVMQVGAAERAVGANERIRIGWNGCGGRGTFVARCLRESPDSTRLHVEDFLECVRSRKRPIADVELGHQATNVAHLANIAYKTGRKLRWDGQRERFVDDAEADRLFAREARKPWNLM